MTSTDQLLSEVQSLVSLRLLAQVGARVPWAGSWACSNHARDAHQVRNRDLLDAPKYKACISFQEASRLAQSVGFDLVAHLYEAASA